MTVSFHDSEYESIDLVYVTNDIRHRSKSDRKLFVPLDKILEIIDREEKQADTVGMAEQYQRGYKDACRFVRVAVQALQEEQE